MHRWSNTSSRLATMVLGGLLVVGGFLLDVGKVVHLDGWHLEAAGVLAMAIGFVACVSPALFHSSWGHLEETSKAQSYEGVEFIADELIGP